MNFDRCFIIKYDEGNDFLANVNEFSEYLSSPELKSTIGFSFSGEDMNIFKNAEEIFENDVNAISENFSDGLRKYLKDFSISSGFQIRLSYGNKYLGVLAAHSTSPRPPFSNDEKNFIRVIARQTGIAIYQSRLYEQEKRIKEREKLSRKIIETIRSSLDEEETLEIICTEVAKLFNVQKVAIIEFPDTSNFQNWILRKEYKSKNNEDDINSSYLEYLGEVALERGEQLVISNISNANINEHFKNLYNSAGIKSILSLPIQKKEKKFGIIYLATTDYEKNWSYDEIDFLEIISNQIYVAITQAELYSTAKRQAEVQNAILNNIPFMAWLKDREGKFIATNKNFCQNYKLKLSDIIGKTDFDITPYELAKRYAEDDKEVMKTGKTLTREEIILTESGIGWSETIKSPLFDENKNIIGTTGVAKDITERKKYEKELLRRQVLILRQSRREMLLRNVINTIRSSIEIDKIKENIVNEVGRVFNADRCFLREYDIKNDRFLKPEVEYLSSPSIQSILDTEPDQEGLKYFFEQAQGKDKTTPIEISEETFRQKNIENTPLNRYFKNSQIKTDLAIPVWGKTGELTFLALHYIKRSIPLSKEDKELLITLSKQISIALEQSELYSEVKVQAERERIRGKVVEIIRSSLNLKVVLKSICEELLSLFDVQRIFIGKLDFTAKQNFIEIVKGNKTIEVSSTEYFNSIAKYWENQIKTKKTKKIVNNIEESDLPENIKENYKDLNIKSIIAIPIKSHDEIWGGLFLSTVKQTKVWSDSEISFLESIVNQLDTAIRQAELYEFQKKIAKKESALREIISEIKLTRDLNQAYNKLLEKLTEIFKLNRALFLESSSIDPDELSIKYEYVIDREDLKVNHLIFPPVCVEKFLNLIHNLEPLVIDDVFSCHPASALEFFKKYKMNALMAVPLVKYNRETKVLGFIVLCSEEKRHWEKEEIELINAISESVVSVIWEISKFIEIEDLRNSFVLTLAHDFQVPLIGEKLAIEFLLKEESITMENSKEILNEILENNRNIINMLNKSVDIYNYEAGKKVLDLENYSISYILQQAVSTLKRKAQLKKVKINMKKSSQNILINVDKTEILKALDTVIQNAIDHSPEGETVEINYYKKFNRLLISVHNNGPEIPPATQEIIFKRYEMALAIERKIGAGTGLFLSQKIINAHKGSIWFETSKKNGTNFFISLPFV